MLLTIQPEIQMKNKQSAYSIFVTVFLYYFLC